MDNLNKKLFQQASGMNLDNNNTNLICAFDFETTGLCKKSKSHIGGYFPPDQIKEYDGCRAVSLAWAIYNIKSKTIACSNYIIKPDGFVSSPGALNVHGITNEYAEKHGVPIKDVLEHFYNDLIKCSILVGHNSNFDYNVLMSECYRNNNRRLSTLILDMKKQFRVKCTMRLASRVLQDVEDFKPRRKYYPSLEYTYRYLFNVSDFQTKHNALDDTLRCGEIYLQLLHIKDTMDRQDAIEQFVEPMELDIM